MKNMLKLVLAAGLLVTVSACIRVPSTSGNAYSSFEKPFDESPTGLGYRIVRISTRAAEKSNDIVADCKIMGDGFISEVTTPALVALPVVDSDDPSVKMECTYDGQTRDTPFSYVPLRNINDIDSFSHEALGHLSSGIPLFTANDITVVY